MESKVKTGKKDRSAESLKVLSLAIGDFIRYWGFRRVHGAIWTQLYLSRTGLSCADLTTRLGLSKALISPALDELCQHRLIFVGPSPNYKVKIYQASENINEVIRHVLMTREALMVKKITAAYKDFSTIGGHSEEINSDRIQSLEEMIFGAEAMLDFFLQQNDLLKTAEQIQK